MVRRTLLVLLVVVVGIAIVNDAGRYIVTWYNLTETTQEGARVAARTSGNRDAAAVAASEYAAGKDVTVYAFDMDESRVYVYTEASLAGTWFLSPILGTIQGGNLSKDYALRAEHSALRQ